MTSLNRIGGEWLTLLGPVIIVNSGSPSTLYSQKKLLRLAVQTCQRFLRLSSTSFFSFPFSIQKNIVLYTIKGPTSFKRPPNPGFAHYRISHRSKFDSLSWRTPYVSCFFLETTQPKSYVRGIFDGAGWIIAPVTIWSFLTIFLWGIESDHPPPRMAYEVYCMPRFTGATDLFIR